MQKIQKSLLKSVNKNKKLQNLVNQNFISKRKTVNNNFNSNVIKQIKQEFNLRNQLSKFKFCSQVSAEQVPYKSDSIPEEVLQNNDVVQILNSEEQKLFRNVAIVAHVDHGKTTLVDSLLQHCGCNLNHERSLDGNELEKEKGITILSKCTSITYKGHKINVVDTPGHGDFGGEVERIMGMVDSVILLVCATEGPMPQTRYVLQKAIRQGLNPIVVVNKVDRPTARPDDVVNEVFGLFCDLEIDDELLDYPVFFCSGRDGWAASSLQKLKNNDTKDISVILDAIIDHVPAPVMKKKDDELKILVSQTESNQYFGKMLIGRIESGTLNLNDKLSSVDSEGKLVENGKVQKIMKKYGMETIEMQRAVAGDIVSIAGFSNSTVTNTLNEQGKYSVIPSIPIDPPIMSISVNVNTSPLAGKEGKKLSKNQIKQRLKIESENDVALKIEGIDDKVDSNDIVIKGRGDLHLGLLIEKMRREGFELAVSPPIILFKEDENGNLLEPMEKITIECDPMYVPGIMEKLGNRGAIYESAEEISRDLHQLHFNCPTRGLIGFRSVLLNDTKGTANMESYVIGYEPHKGVLAKHSKGALISTATGVTTHYAIKNMEQFGTMFIKPNQKVYTGMIIGEHVKEGDQELNPTKAKQLNNIRTKSHEEKIILTPPRTFTVEEAVAYIRDDEMVEVTPQEIRMRKKTLESSMRKRESRQAGK